MLALSTERIGNLAVVECEGTITHSEAACKLRDTVTSLEGMQLIVLDLSELTLLEANGLSMFLFLQQWAYQHHIQLKIFNPRWWVLKKLEHAAPIPGFDIASIHEVTVILANADGRFALPA